MVWENAVKGNQSAVRFGVKQFFFSQCAQGVQCAQGLHNQTIRYKHINLGYTKANYLIHSVIQVFNRSVPQRVYNHNK